MIKLLKGNCLEQMKSLPDNSVDSIVTDPPYGISFMAKKWDYDVPSVEVWHEAMRVLKPGGHALIACGTRTQHRMVVNIEDAGFEIRDVVSWIYGSGFPKSLNISKAIDKAAGAEREVIGKNPVVAANKKCAKCGRYQFDRPPCDCVEPELIHKHGDITAPATEAAKQWDGWGTALKPACEFFTLCRKPLSEKTIAKNVLKWGTGGINIDECRVETEDKLSIHAGNLFHGNSGIDTKNNFKTSGQALGRFPANLIHDGSQEVLDLFPETKSGGGDKHGRKPSTFCASTDWEQFKGKSAGGDQGSAARFFYCPKASKKDRDEGLEGFDEKSNMRVNGPRECEEDKTSTLRKNHHPTVKPTALMQYLCRLITPTGGVVLDPYMGSGSTGKAAIKEGFGFVGCELDEDYFLIASQRVKNELD